jgi:hypothetical protein
MTIAALSPNSILASPASVNPQVKNDLQASSPQVAQDAQKAAKVVQTDTITISTQALKMADEKNVVAQKAANKAEDLQAFLVARDKEAAVKNQTQKNASQAYSTISAYF